MTDDVGAVRSVDAEEWRRLQRSFADANYRQLWGYGLVSARKAVAESESVVVERGGEPVGIANVRVKQLPVVGSGLAYISGGPLTRHAPDCVDADDLRTTLTALAREYVERRGLVLRVLCPLGPAEWNADAQRVLDELGFVHSEQPRPYRTFVVDTARDEEAILGSVSGSWRKCARRSLRRGVTTRLGTSAEAFGPVQELHDALVHRKQFDSDLGGRFYAAVQRELADEEKLIVILAELEGAICGMQLVSVAGDAVVGIIGATTDAGAKHYAAHALYWRAMQLAHERGCRVYDSGGIDPEGNPSVYQFKCGLKGEDISAPRPAELHPSGLRGRLVRSGEKGLRSVRAWRKRRDARSV